MQKDFGLFDLQMFGTTVISQGLIDEMTLVGAGFAPRNPKAKALAVKAGAVSANIVDEKFSFEGKDFKLTDKAPSFVAAIVKASPENITEFSAKGWMISTEVPDKIDNDGDGADDYENIIRLISGSYYDVQAAMGIGSDVSRSAALVSVIDSFLEALDAIRDGEDNVSRKAGRKMSNAMIERVNKLKDHAKAHMGMIDDLLKEGGVAPAKKADEDVPVDGNAPIVAPVTTPPVEQPPEPAKPVAAVAPADAITPPVAEAIVPPVAEPEVKAAPTASGLTATEIVEAVKASIVMPPDNTQLITDLANGVKTLAERVASVETTATNKATALEKIVSAAASLSQAPVGSGGLEVLDTAGRAPTTQAEATAKAAAVELSPDMSAADGALAIQRAIRNGKVQ